jgi:hypothetical protein
MRRVGLEIGADSAAAIVVGAAVVRGGAARARRRATELGNADVILALRIGSAADNARAAAAESASVAFARAEGIGQRLRRVVLGGGGGMRRVALGDRSGVRRVDLLARCDAPIAGGTRRHTRATAVAVRGRGRGDGSADNGDRAGAGQAGESPNHVTTGESAGESLRQSVESGIIHLAFSDRWKRAWSDWQSASVSIARLNPSVRNGVLEPQVHAMESSREICRPASHR